MHIYSCYLGLSDTTVRLSRDEGSLVEGIDVPTSTRSDRFWVLALASTASLMAAIDVLAVSTALTTIRSDLHASTAQLEWTVTAYNLSFAALMMAASALGERWGRRTVFAAGLAIFTAASAGCAVAPGINILIALRAVQGAGAAAVSALAFALITATFPEQYRGRALGIAGGVTGMAVLAGPLIGGGLTQAIGWQWIFWVNVPIGALATVLALWRIQESRGARTPIDVHGVALITGAVFAVVWAFIRATGVGWHHADVVVPLIAGVGLLVGFIRWEARARAPLLPRRLFDGRAFAAANIATFFHAAIVLGPVFLMAQFFQTSLGYGPFQAGVRLLPWTVTLLAVAPLAGVLADRIGQRPVVVAGLILSAAGLAWLALAAGPDVHYALIAGPLLISGVGNSAVFPAVQSAVVSDIGPNDIGTATGANQMIREVGGVLGIALLASVFAANGSYASPEAFAHGFSVALWVCSSLAIAGAAAGAALPPQSSRMLAPSGQ